MSSPIRPNPALPVAVADNASVVLPQLKRTRRMEIPASPHIPGFKQEALTSIVQSVIRVSGMPTGYTCTIELAGVPAHASSEEIDRLFRNTDLPHAEEIKEKEDVNTEYRQQLASRGASQAFIESTMKVIEEINSKETYLGLPLPYSERSNRVQVNFKKRDTGTIPFVLIKDKGELIKIIFNDPVTAQEKLNK